MLTKTILITGCNRGLGLEMVTQLLSNPAWKPDKIIATCRRPQEAAQLNALAAQNPTQLKVLPLEVTDYQGLPSFVESVKAELGSDGLGCLINNAGFSPGMTRLTTVQPEQMMETFNINTVAPLMIIKALLGLLKESNGHNQGNALQQPLIVNISSILGSIAENNENAGSMSGGVYPYRASKAALNMMTRNVSLDLAKNQGQVQAICIHPGWVQTDMGGPNAPVTPQQSIQGILTFLGAGISQEQNGNYFDFEGKAMDW
ncbi:hypothetical protein TCAL_08658 [Tigriopus californicus]|uniref:C-factor n=1 Tax=Tigriopus californicus TaxID=6832 RepID=A0A553PDJ8_TIGCA|nr:C-signal-like [Tigriopus californicus]TRY75758.1 hypothetical protein TCAL_08658 [Tigriopus californicus]